MRIARLSFGIEAVDHGCTNGVETGHQQGIKHIIKRIAVRSAGHNRTCRACLVVVIHDLGQPLDVELAVHVLRFFQVHHEEIAVVIVSGILLIQAGYTLQTTLLRI